MLPAGVVSKPTTILETAATKATNVKHVDRRVTCGIPEKIAACDKEERKRQVSKEMANARDQPRKEREPCNRRKRKRERNNI